MPETMRQILRELDEDRPPGYLDVSGALLDMSSETREQFVRAAQGRRNLTIADGGFHDCSLGFTKPSFGITYMFGLSQNSSEISRRLEAYCQMKKYQTKSAEWYGLGCLADTPGWTHIGIALKEPWRYDEEMERLVAEALPPLEMGAPHDWPG